jgi:hypothetical protein
MLERDLLTHYEVVVVAVKVLLQLDMVVVVEHLGLMVVHTLKAVQAVAVLVLLAQAWVAEVEEDLTDQVLVLVEVL